MSQKRFAVLALLAALAFASVPAHAACRPARPAVAEIGETKAIFQAVWRFFAGFLLKEGVTIDPNGNTVDVDEGMSIDPNGSKG